MREAISRTIGKPSGFQPKGTPYTFADFEAGMPPPLSWDCADAVEEGWTKRQLDAFMVATVRPWTPPKKPAEKVEDKRELAAEPSMPLATDGAGSPAFWADQFVTNADGKVLPNVTRNWTLLLENHDQTHGMLALDEFSGETMLMRRPPWDHARGAWVPRPIRNVDLAEVVDWLESNRMTPKVSNIAPVIDKVAARNPYHPVRGYFHSLPKWDGVKRLDTFLSYYLGAEDTPLNRGIGRKWLCAVAWRVFEPGCKFDSVLVLQGAQGIGKSAFGKALVPIPKWVSESVTIGDRAREVIENTSGVLIVELAELAGKSNKEVEAIKKFITITEDKARGAYKHKVEAVPRQFVFYATTNQDEFLTDTTGNRRWWPVTPAGIDLDAICADRDQLWAEVMNVYRSERLWLDDPELQAELDELNKGKTDYGPTFEIIRDLIPQGDMLVPPDELRRLLAGGSDDPSRLHTGWRAGLHKALVGLGFEANAEVVRKGKAVTRAYIRGDKANARWARYSNGRIEFEDMPRRSEDEF